MEQYYNLRLGSGWDCCPTRQPQTLLAPSPPPGQLQGTLPRAPLAVARGVLHEEVSHVADSGRNSTPFPRVQKGSLTD